MVIKAVFFDWDFTLVDPKIVLKKLLDDFCEKYKIPKDKYNIDELMLLNMKQVFKKLGIKKISLPYILYEYLKLTKKYSKYYKFTGKETLKYLEKNNIPYVIITDNFKNVLRKNFDVHPEFIIDYWSTRGKKKKGIKKALKKMKLKPHEVCYVGDKPSDVIAANEADVFSIGILTTHSKEEMLKYEPDMLITKIDDVKKLFK